MLTLRNAMELGLIIATIDLRPISKTKYLMRQGDQTFKPCKDLSKASHMLLEYSPKIGIFALDQALQPSEFHTGFRAVDSTNQLYLLELAEHRILSALAVKKLQLDKIIK